MAYKNIKIILLLVLLVLSPLQIYAATSSSVPVCSNTNVQGIIACVIGLFTRLIPITASFALLFFMWGVSKILRAQGDTGKIEEGRRTAFWGIIALFIIISLGGIVVFLQQDLIGGLKNTVFP
ncbi:MAG: hypothetical protein WA051_02340 [Minisyncoccia bacterium]